MTRKRRTQQRAIDTRDALLDTAINQFSRLGYEGVSVRSIEEAAGVNRGLVAYHFGEKAELWRQAVNRLFTDMRAALSVGIEASGGVDTVTEDTIVTRLVKTFVRYSAAHPAVNRLMMQESLQPSWRVQHLVEEEIRPLMTAMLQQLPDAAARVWGAEDPHRYYLFIGASAFVFSAAEECKALFGVSPTDDAFVERHAELVLNTLFPGIES